MATHKLDRPHCRHTARRMEGRYQTMAALAHGRRREPAASVSFTVDKMGPADARSKLQILRQPRRPASSSPFGRLRDTADDGCGGDVEALCSRQPRRPASSSPFGRLRDTADDGCGGDVEALCSRQPRRPASSSPFGRLRDTADDGCGGDVEALCIKFVGSLVAPRARPRSVACATRRMTAVAGTSRPCASNSSAASSPRELVPVRSLARHGG